MDELTRITELSRSPSPLLSRRLAGDGYLSGGRILTLFLGGTLLGFAGVSTVLVAAMVRLPLT
jgi:hypothetical protein